MGAGTLMMTVTPVVTTAVTTMCSHRFISNKPCGLGTQRSGSPVLIRFTPLSRVKETSSAF